MTNITKERVFLLDCPSCKRKHRMTVQPCPSCGGGGGWIAMPASERVREDCGQLDKCDGCEAYEDRYR